MTENTKKQLADAICKTIFRNEFLCADREEVSNKPCIEP